MSPSFRGTRAAGWRCLLALALAVAGCATADFSDDPDASFNDLGGDTSGTDDADAADTARTDGAGPDDVIGPGCRAASDCASSAAGPVCDPATGRCVACTPAEDVCVAGNYCDPATNACRTGCRTDRDCGGGATRCDAASHTCVGCAADADCAPGTVCRAGACVPGCSAERPCGVGATCCGGTCADLQADARHCGACGAACAGGGQCCAGACVATATDPRHCGGCGVTCAPDHATPACAAGACGVGACEPGFGDCDRTAVNGCEVDTGTDPAHCGACGARCPRGTNAEATCAAGRCGLTCAAGYDDCDREPTNGCEVELVADPIHCGACNRRCPVGLNATARCAMATCSIVCAEGFGDCDGDPANGCEVDLARSTAHCGACGVACGAANAVTACAAGRCGIERCAAGFGNCDGSAANGCETPTATDNANCGACGRACPAGTACSGGVCASICTGGAQLCGGRCVDPTVDVAHCGGCGRACPTGANAAAVCAASACGLACDPGYGDCNRATTDGCEANLRTSLAHCGACGATCSRPNATAACVGGTCRVGACLGGYGDCNGTDVDGCETFVLADARNCGACGRACALAGAVSVCGGGACRVSRCNAGFSNCNAVDADGCETNVDNNNFNCGGCGTTCPPGTACSGGVCRSACAPGTTFCAGACVDLNADGRNCGACGRVCASGLVCRSGSCVTAGAANDRCAGAQDVSLSTPGVTLTANTVGAAHDLDASCGGGGGADVFFRFTIPGPAPELVYADTFGATWDTVLFFASGCATRVPDSSAPGVVVCNDDAGSAGCSAGGLQSQVTALLNPGTYYLVVSGFGSHSGTASVRFQHLPVGSGRLALLASGTSSQSWVTSGSGRVVGCAGSGPEDTYWWRSCPESSGGSFSATTCSRASWDTVLYLRNGSGAGDTCADDTCGVQTTISSFVGSGAGLHALYVDGYFSSSFGSYTVQVTRPN